MWKTDGETQKGYTKQNSCHLVNLYFIENTNYTGLRPSLIQVSQIPNWLGPTLFLRMPLLPSLPSPPPRLAGLHKHPDATFQSIKPQLLVSSALLHQRCRLQGLGKAMVLILAWPLRSLWSSPNTEASPRNCWVSGLGCGLHNGNFLSSSVILMCSFTG